MTSLNYLRKFLTKAYRDDFLETTVRGGIAYQLKALRGKFRLTQGEFAARTGKKQSTISRLESTEYGKVTVQTLLDIASSLEVALLVRFVDYPTFLYYARNMSEADLQPQTIQESVSCHSPSAALRSVSDRPLWARRLEQASGQSVDQAGHVSGLGSVLARTAGTSEISKPPKLEKAPSVWN